MCDGMYYTEVKEMVMLSCLLHSEQPLSATIHMSTFKFTVFQHHLRRSDLLAPHVMQAMLWCRTLHGRNVYTDCYW